MHNQNSPENTNNIHFTDRYGNTIEVNEDGEHLRLTKNGLISQSVTVEHFHRLIARGTIIQTEEEAEREDEELAA